MKFPSESMIEAAFSEVKSHAEERALGKDKHTDQCDFCQIMMEMSKRNEDAGEGKCCQLDGITLDIATSNPLIGMVGAAPFAGTAMVETLSTIGRMCFLIGLKAARSEDAMKKMEELFSKE